jgi:exodeoxyribonuclease VIII
MSTAISLDLETLGKTGVCAVLSIGAVAFDTDTLELIPGAEFYGVVSQQSSWAAGLTADANTLQWWAAQSDEVRSVLQETSLAYPTLFYTLSKFTQWATSLEDPSKVEMWGNGSDFDNAILSAAYAKVGIEPPWRFWNSRCLRTLKGLCKPAPSVERVGVRHNALDDARYQAQCAVAYLAHLRGGSNMLTLMGNSNGSA